MISSARAWLFTLGAALALLLAIATAAPAAVWVGLKFTAPPDIDAGDGRYVSGVGRYRIEAWNGTTWDTVRIYRAPGVEGVPVQPAGETVNLFVSQSIQPLTSRTYRVRAVDLRGNVAPVSNQLVVATAFPDMVVGLSRPAVPFGYAFQRSIGQPLAWQLRYGDDAEVHAAHQEEIQRAYRDRICRLYPSWGFRGVQVACP